MSETAGQWLRVSTKGQDETSQKPDNASWITGHGYDLAKTYTVHGYSAFKGNAKFDKTWAKVLDDIRAGIITVLIVWKTDRIDRKLETFKRIAEVVEAGGRVEFATQPHLNDLSTMGGRIALKVQEEIAYAESKDKSDRINANHAMIRSNGGCIGRPTFGYRASGDKYSKTFVIHTAEAATIREAKDRYLDGETIDAICADFMARGIPGPMFKGQPMKTWHAKTLAGILRNTSTAGIRKNAAGQIVCQYDGIITWDEHMRLVARLDSRAHRKGISPKNVALLTSVIFDKAGHPMYRINSWNSSMYYCRKCHASVDLDTADASVSQWFANDNEPYMIPTVVSDTHDKEMAILRNERDGLDDLSDDYEVKHAALTSEIRRLAKLPQTRTIELRDSGKTYAEVWASLDNAQRRDMLLESDFTVTWLGDGKWTVQPGQMALVIE
jgi:DNA invertase Pin-like site-specific DNA recombinase